MKYIFGIICLAIGLASSAVYAQDAAAPEEKRSALRGNYQKADTDGDGAVSKAEFLAQAEERFGKMDLNSDGIVTQEEIEARKKAYKDKKKEEAANRDGAQGEPKAEPAEQSSETPATDPAVEPAAEPAEGGVAAPTDDAVKTDGATSNGETEAKPAE